MKYILVSCKDIKSEVFTPPIPFRSDAEAVRAYGDAVGKDPMLSKYPEDFELHKVAFWDNETGLLDAIQDNTKICRISDIYVKAEVEVTSDNAGGFPVFQVDAQGDQVVVEEGAQVEQKRLFKFGGNQK